MPLSRRLGYLVRSLPALAAVAAGACSDPSGPRDRDGLRLVAGATLTDTIQARPLQALVAEVRDGRGEPISGMIVRFEAQPIEGQSPDPWCYYCVAYGAYVSRVDQSQYVQMLADTTDERGRASALVQLGTKAGEAVIVVAVPELGAVDTARYTVTAGAAAAVVAAPADTALFPTKTFTMRAAVTDRFGNERTDAVTYSAGGTGIAVSGSTVTAQATGRGLVIARAGARADTAYVSVVPEATLAATTNNALVTFKSDGSAYTTIASTPSRGLTSDWSPDGTQILFDEDWNDRLFVATVGTGAVRTVNTSALFGEWSPDGGTIYYTRVAWRLRRQSRDGTGDADVTMTAPGSDIYPSPSPDGTRLVYGDGYNTSIRILTIATGASTTLGVTGHSPNWSPTGAQIAFVDYYSGELKLMNPDGTNVRTVSPGGRYQRGIDWSPDGRWIVAWNSGTDRLDLIDTQSTTVLPLGFTNGMAAPSWKP